jgi:capsular exopolysaccharide synthesis family protein
LRMGILAVAPDFTRLSAPQSRLLDYIRALPYANVRGSKALTQAIHHTASRGDVYRSIRNALLFSRVNPPPKTVLVTSGIEGEGKTWTAIQTALAFAQTEATTLLIDADLRRARCHQALGVDNHIGLSDVLLGRCEAADALHFLERQNLFLLTAGSRVSNASELLTSERMSWLLVALSQAYDFIVIDSAPVMLASDTAGIATMTDGVVLVGGARTSRQDVRRATELLTLAGANILGLVLNQMDRHAATYDQYSRYYASQDADIEVSDITSTT